MYTFDVAVNVRFVGFVPFTCFCLVYTRFCLVYTLGLVVQCIHCSFRVPIVHNHIVHVVCVYTECVEYTPLIVVCSLSGLFCVLVVYTLLE